MTESIIMLFKNPRSCYRLLRVIIKRKQVVSTELRCQGSIGFKLYFLIQLIFKINFEIGIKKKNHIY